MTAVPPPATEPDSPEQTADALAESQAEREQARRRRIEKSAGWHEEQELAKRLGRQRADKVADQVINGQHLTSIPLSRFGTKGIRWAWEKRIAVGEITLVCGREGVGKSTFLADMAARVTTGELPGAFHGEPRDVLYVATEDSWESTIRPRMEVAGADLDRVHQLLVDVEDVGPRKLLLPLDATRLDELWSDHGVPGTPGYRPALDPAMLMLDPAISVIDDKINTFKAQELRTALEPLKRAADRLRIAVVGLAHFNKGKDTDVLTLIAGARAWTEVARGVIAIALDKDAEEYTCVVSQVKNNIGRLNLPNLTYTIDSVDFMADDGIAMEVGRLRWTGETDRTAEDLLRERDPKTAVGDSTNGVIDFVRAKFGETGKDVPTKDIVDYFAGKMTASRVRQILARSVSRGDLIKAGYGAYRPIERDQQVAAPIAVAGPVPVASRPCATEYCGNPAETGGHFCTMCREDLDDDDRRNRSTQDPLWM